MSDFPTPPRSDWDDARLDASFRQRCGGALPSGLPDRIHAALAEQSRAPRSWLPVAPIAAAATILVAIGILVIGSNLAPVGPTPSPTSRPSFVATATPGLTTAPASSALSRLPWPFPDRVTSGDTTYDVLTVDEAVATRDTDASARSIAVAGWESFATDIRFCTIARPGILGQLENQCVFNRWLADAPQPMSSWYDPPVTPAFRFAWERGVKDDEIRFAGGSFPRGSHTAEVLVGHFHDPLVGQCDPASRRQCDSVFVVTDVPWTLTAATFRPPPPESTFAPMTVDEAVGVRDAADSPAELAVGGWYVRNIVPCPPLPSAQVPLEDCMNDFTWLMANPEQLAVLASDGSGSVQAPTGPAISLVLGERVAPQTSAPVFSLAIGHFRDAGAADCPPGGRALACERRFVVDIILELPAPAGSPGTSP